MKARKCLKDQLHKISQNMFQFVFLFSFFCMTLNDCRCTRRLFFFCLICCCRRLLQVEQCAESVIAMDVSGVQNQRQVTRVREVLISSPPPLSLLPSPPSLSLSCSGTERGADGPSVIQRGMFHVHLAQAQIPPAGKLFSGQPPVIRGWSLLHSTA